MMDMLNMEIDFWIYFWFTFLGQWKRAKYLWDWNSSKPSLEPLGITILYLCITWRIFLKKNHIWHNLSLFLSLICCYFWRKPQPQCFCKIVLMKKRVKQFLFYNKLFDRRNYHQLLNWETDYFVTDHGLYDRKTFYKVKTVFIHSLWMMENLSITKLAMTNISFSVMVVALVKIL